MNDFKPEIYSGALLQKYNLTIEIPPFFVTVIALN